VDRNDLQITGRTEDVCAIEPLADKAAAFGWSVREADGHDVAALSKVLGAVPFQPDKPGMVIARTVKGKGVSFIENVAGWHHHVPSDEEYDLAMRELDEALAMLEAESKQAG
jgi:transketolase